MLSYKYKANGVSEIEREFCCNEGTKINAALRDNGFDELMAVFENPASTGSFDFTWHMETSFDVMIKGGALAREDAWKCRIRNRLSELCMKFCDNYDAYEIREIEGENGIEGYKCKITA